MIESLLLLLGQLVLEYDIELGSKVPVLGHVLNQDREPLRSFIVQILLVVNLREQENDLLESLVVLAQDEEGVLLEKGCEELVHLLGLIEICLKGQEGQPVGDQGGDIDCGGLELDDLSKSRDCVVLGMHELLCLRFLLLYLGRHLEFNSDLKTLQAVVGH